MSSKASGSRSEIAAASIGLVTAVGLLATLLPIPRALAMSNQPWVGELVISGLLFAFVVWALLSSDRIKFCGSVRSTLIFMCAFTVWSLCSLLWASDDWAALHHTFEWVIYACVVLLAASLIENGNAYRPLMYGLGFTAIILFLICASDFLSVADFASSETVIRIRYGKFGEMTALIAPLLAGAGLYGRSKKYLIMSAAAWMCSWMVTMLSLSKGAFIAGIIGHAVMFIGVFIFTKQGRRRALIACLGWVVLTLGAQAYSSYATSVPATTDYITGAADRTRSTSEMRVFTWKTSWTLAKTHLLLGVGADNFGVRFNEARILRAHSADDNSPEIAEDYVVERAHNEALQMLAELGIPGVILCCLIFVPLLLCIARRPFAMSPMLWAAVGGMAAFAASSMVSSFSFRVVQNGAAFFIVFAIALNEAARSTREKRTVSSNRTVNIAAAAAALLSVAYFGSKAYAEDLVYLSERTSDTGAAHRLYKTSIRVDPDNANARYSYSYRLFSSNEPGAAAAELRSAIDRGLGVTITYTTLSKYFEAAEQRQDAESVYREALSIFPNSVYLRVSYACFLERNGRPEESRSELLFARNISGPQANGWYELIIHGSVAAYLAAQKNPDYTAPADLLPANAVSQYVDDPLDPKPLAPPAATR